MTEIEQQAPFWLRGNYAPVEEERDAFDLEVTGAVPPVLTGRYIRNGPNPRQPSAHWFTGDGMLHGVELASGKATAYRNRWVRTRAFAGDGELIGPDGTVDHTVAVANTHIVRHADRYLALVESSYPTEVRADLSTVGIHDFDGTLTSAMTAHPKTCPTTGELHFFGYGFFPPYLVYNVADAAGDLVHTEEIPVPGPTMIHDFNLTAGHVVFMDLPVVFDLEMAFAGEFPYRWSDDYGARFGVLPRRGSASEIRWFDVEPCYVFHPLNSWDDGDRVVIDACRYERLWDGGPTASTPGATLHRWTIDMSAGTVAERPLDDRPSEFPRVDDRTVSLPHTTGWAVGTAPLDHDRGGDGGNELLKTDATGAVAATFAYGSGRTSDEAVFAPAGPDAAEDEGWLLSYVHDAATNRSDLVIVDARDLTETARVHLPVRVPKGFHGNWFPDA